MTTLPRVNYGQMSKEQATRTHRRRLAATRVMRYAENSRDLSELEVLYEALDRFSDEEFEAYIRHRKARSNLKAKNIEVDQHVDHRVEKLDVTPEALPRGTIGNLQTAERGSIGTESTVVPQGSVAAPKLKYSKSTIDRAVQYCTRERASGRQADYQQVLEELHRGNLR